MEELKNTLLELKRRIEELEKIQPINVLLLPDDGTGILRVPKYTSDPSSPADGEIWVNTTSNTLKVRLGGVTRTVTVS